MFGLTMIRDYLNEILDGSKNSKTKKEIYLLLIFTNIVI